MKKFDRYSPPHMADWNLINSAEPILVALARKKYPDTTIAYLPYPSSDYTNCCIKCLICDKLIYFHIESYDDLNHMFQHLEEHKTLLNML